tara:strand:- start:818 stop:1213 length:396 start_codon:yes stop_codon:yes gene_type:complete
MNNLELLLRKYAKNFHISDNIIKDDKIEYLNFHNIITVTDNKLTKVSSIEKLINFLKKKLNSKFIILDSTEPNYEMIESTTKEIINGKYDLVIALGGVQYLMLSRHLPFMKMLLKRLIILLVPKSNIQRKY